MTVDAQRDLFGARVGEYKVPYALPHFVDCPDAKKWSKR